MPDKKVIGTSTSKSVKTTTEPDGTVVTTTTTTTTEKYSDGSTGKKVKVETETAKRVTGATTTSSSGGPPVSTPKDPATCDAPKAENTTDPNWIQQALDHNAIRAKHGAPPLTLNKDLGKIAMAWAQKLAKSGNLQHNTSGFGENVYWSTENIDGARPPDMWYSEIKDFNFNKLEGQKGTGHFTQLIWKSTKEMGIAMAGGSKGNFVVANYNPPGNVVGRYAENIQK